MCICTPSNRTPWCDNCPPICVSNGDLGFDPVNRPKHYNNSDAKCSECSAPIECIDITRHMHFNIGNAVKYLWRFRDKGGIEDLKKARWYLDDHIEHLESKEPELQKYISEPMDNPSPDLIIPAGVYKLNIRILNGDRRFSDTVQILTSKTIGEIMDSITEIVMKRTSLPYVELKLTSIERIR